MNAYTKIHIPTKNEVMEDMIAICKAIADSLLTPKPADDIKAIFVESNNGDLEFYGFIGDGTGTIDTDGNLLRIGDTIEMHCKNGHSLKEYVLMILPKQKSINFFNGKLVKSYKNLSKNICSQDHGIFHFISCLDEYYKSIDNLL
jgi:hypothetical protein